MRPILLLTCLLCSFVALSQVHAADALRYHDLVNTAERAFLTERDSSCYPLYDEAFSVHRPFLKDPYIAAQIAFSLRDTARFLGYLQVGFRHGMPLTAVYAAPLLRGAGQRVRELVRKRYTATRASTTVDPVLRDTVCAMCYRSDSIKVRMGRDTAELRRFLLEEMRTRRFLLDSFLIHGRFVNEQVLGISSDIVWHDFLRRTARKDPYAVPGLPAMAMQEELELRLKCPLNIVLHGNCFFQQHRALFEQALRNGTLHPKDFAILEETSVLWYKKPDAEHESCPPPVLRSAYYNIFHGPADRTYVNTPEGLAEVERNRAAIHLQTYAADEEKLRLERAEGFAFFFDFVDRPGL